MDKTKFDGVVKVVYIGEGFYHASGTIMSNMVYEDGSRCSVSDVLLMVEAGKTVTIRPATDAEMGRAYRNLRAIQSS